MFSKKNIEKRKIYDEDCSVLRKKYQLYRDAQYDLEKIFFLVTDKIFLVEGDTSQEFTEKYNDFILKAQESMPQYIFRKPNSIRIKNKSEIQFANNKYIMIINYDEFILKKEYSNEEYLKRKDNLEKLYKEYRDYANIFCEKHDTDIDEVLFRKTF